MKATARPCVSERFESAPLARAIGATRGRVAYHCKGCGDWHIGRKTKAGPKLADDVKVRRTIRQAHGSAKKQERTQAEALNVALKEPLANETVRRLQSRATHYRNLAARERQKAEVAVSQRKKREFTRAARKFEDQARPIDTAAKQARERQLDQHWAGLAISETEQLTIARHKQGIEDEMITDTTEVPDWVREESGALARGADGLPMLRVETAKPRRRRAGLELLRKKDAISASGYDVGIWYGELCANAQVALIAGREETGLPASPASKASPGPANWKIEALVEKAAADAAIMRALPRKDGAAMVALLVAVCFDGWSCHFIAGKNDAETLRLEARIGTGLAMLRHHRLCRIREKVLDKV